MGLPVGEPFPRDHESWREYAEHCLTHDPLPDRIAEWHDSEEDGTSLHEYLKMSWEEYQQYVQGD